MYKKASRKSGSCGQLLLTVHTSSQARPPWLAAETPEFDIRLTLLPILSKRLTWAKSEAEQVAGVATEDVMDTFPIFSCAETTTCHDGLGGAVVSVIEVDAAVATSVAAGAMVEYV